MNQETLIALEEICNSYNIEIPFIYSLSESGLIKLVIIREDSFVDHMQLPRLEKYINFHYTLGINIEGIETIHHLLLRMETLQEEVNRLKNALHFHEGGM